MPVEWKQESDRLVRCRVSGTLTFEEWERLNAGDRLRPAEEPVDPERKLRVLIVLDGFEGWAQNEGWEDISWVEVNDRRLQRLAFVGEERWREPMEVFALKGLRPVEIEYFKPEQEDAARAWLQRD